VISSSIFEAGYAERANLVHCGVVGQIAMAWNLTIPAAIILGDGFYLLLVTFL
jgi:phosphate/sulfate permease